MPPRRRARSMEPYFTPSGQGKLFYEPAAGPQQARQEEQKTRRWEFEETLDEIVRSEDRPPPAESQKIRDRVIADAPRDAGRLRLSQMQTEDFNAHRERTTRHWELGRAAGLSPAEILRRQHQTGHSPARFTTPGNWAASSPLDPATNPPEEARQLLGQETVSRVVRGQRKRVTSDVARTLAKGTSVPPSSLGGLQGFVARSMGGERSVAHYSPLDREIHVASGHTTDASTLTHEIGHHVSSKTEGYPERRETRIPDHRGGSVAPAEEAFADDYAATHADPGYRGYADGPLGADPTYRAARRVPSMLSREEFEGEQGAIFDVEPAFAPNADAEVQALTTDEGRSVIGWGPKKYGTPGSTHKHAYDPSGQSEFWGANYAAMFQDDIIPDRRRDDWETQSFRHTDPVVKQPWKGR